MEIACTHCNGKFKLPDQKIPQGQVFSLACPKCKKKITIDTRTAAPQTPQDRTPTTLPKTLPKTLIDEVASGSYDAEEKPFDFVEQGAKTALLCEPDPALCKSIKAALSKMDFHTTEPQDAKAALKQMRFHVFDLLVLNELFDTRDADTNHVLAYLNHLPMGVRRNIFVVLLTQNHRTTDNMAAFNKSVNLIVNPKNTAEFEKILKRGLADHKAFYRVYKESLAKTGLV